MHLRNFGISFLIAAIPGIILPIFFGFIASLDMAGVGRDELPGMGHPLATIGLIGLFISSIPAMLVAFGLMILVNYFFSLGYTIPLFDLLPASAQVTSLFVLGYFCNVLVWLLPVSYIRRLKAQIASSSAVSGDDSNSSQGPG